MASVLSTECEAGDIELAITDDNDDAVELSRRLARRRNTHRSMLAMAGFVVLMALLLEVRPDQRVQFFFAPGWPAPESCASRLLWGTDCPGCGLTRGFVHLAHGEFGRAWNLNRMSWLFAAAVLLQFPYRVWMLRELAGGTIVRRRWPSLAGQFLIFALVANWVLKQFAG